MDNLEILTSQNVNLEIEPASVAERIFARIIDYILMISYIIVIAIMMGVFKISDELTILFLITLPILFYDLLCEVFFDGRNFGKAVLGIKVVMLDGSSPRISSYLLRWIFRIIDEMVTFGSIAVTSIVVSSGNQRIGDRIAGTTVIRLKSKRTLSSIVTDVPDTYNPHYTEAKNLSDDDISLIRDVLKMLHQTSYSDVSINMREKLRAKIETKLGVKSHTSSEAFLETILQDYNRLHR